MMGLSSMLHSFCSRPAWLIVGGQTFAFFFGCSFHDRGHSFETCPRPDSDRPRMFVTAAGVRNGGPVLHSNGNSVISLFALVSHRVDGDETGLIRLTIRLTNFALRKKSRTNLILAVRLGFNWTTIAGPYFFSSAPLFFVDRLSLSRRSVSASAILLCIDCQI